MSKKFMLAGTMTGIVFAFMLLCLPARLFSQDSGHYHLLKSYPLDEEDGWDYLTFDNSANRVYMACASHVEVFDLKEEKIIGDVPNTQGVHGIALAPEFNHGFASCGKTNTVLVFNMKTLDTLRRIRVGEKPDAIIYDPFIKSILVCNGNGKSLTIIDAKGAYVVATIPLGGQPEFIVSDGQGRVYINLEDRSEVVGVNLKNYLPYRRIKLAPGESPTGIAMDVKTNRIFCGCRNGKMIVVNPDISKIVAAIPIGKNVDAVVFDPDKHVAISSNGEGTLSIIREVTKDSFQLAETITTQPGARTETLDPKTHNLYLVTADFGAAPEATKENPNPRPPIIPSTVRLLKYGY